MHYDPMIAKLVVWGPDRNSALMKLHSCLSEYNIDGLANNVNFLMDLASHPEFAKGNVDTDFITRHYDELFPKRVDTKDTIMCRSSTQHNAILFQVPSDGEICAAAMAALLTETSNHGEQFSRGVALNHMLTRKLGLVSGKDTINAIVTYSNSNNSFNISYNEKSFDVDGMHYFP